MGPRALLLLLIVVVLGVTVRPWLLKQGPGAEDGPAAIGGAYALTDDTGHPRRSGDFVGKWTLVYFGFTHCPDICPTGLQTITDSLALMGKEAEQVVPIFITLDPERDDATTLHEYLSHFSPRFVGLTGSADDIAQVAHAYKVYFSREEQPKSEIGYVINHSGFIYLMGPDGTYRTHFDHAARPADMAKEISSHIRGEH